jgi:hypothetical protein
MTTEVVGKWPVGRPKGSTKRMRSAKASTSADAAADDIQEEGNQTSDEGDKDTVDKGTVDKDTVDKGTVDKDTVEAVLREKRAPVARVRQWFEGEPGDKELICIACSHFHKIPTIESVAVHSCVPPWGFHCNSSLLQLLTCKLSKFKGKRETRKNKCPPWTKFAFYKLL